jgi:hypothetical protein
VLLGRDWHSEFDWACKRHDFGYCNAHEPSNNDCYSAASTYYSAVRLKGGFYTS